jgi:hypothetical protein
MPASNAAWRVPVVVRPLDCAFTLSKILLVPALLFAGSIAAIKGVATLGSSYGLIVAAVSVVLYLLVLQLSAVEQRVDRLFAVARRRVALSCDHDYSNQHRDSLACHLTAEALRAPVFRYVAQQGAVAALAQACDSGQGEFWFVEGTSGSGKTRAALMLVQTLLRDITLFELGNRCYMYDFADGGTVQDDLLRWLGTPQNDRAVVLVDNFQLVRADILRVVTERLVERPGSTPEQLIVFLARPEDAWNLSPGSDVRILSEAKGRRRHLSLAGPRSEDILRRVSALDHVAAAQIRSLSDDQTASAAQLHFAQVIVRNGRVPPDLSGLLKVLAGGSSQGHEDLLRAVGAVSAMTVHRGAFRRRELWEAVWRGETGSRVRTSVTAFRDLRRLHRVGLVTRISLGGTRFAFHEAIAELCIDQLISNPAFEPTFRRFALARLATLKEAREPLGAWLVGAETGEQDVLVDTFDAAMARGAYARMTRCLRRAEARYSLSEQSRLQLAILSDRVGDFAGSRALVNSTQVGDSRLGALLTAQRIETNHDTDSIVSAAALRSSSEADIALVGEYWERHIAGHRGEFAPERLLALATVMRQTSGDRDDYWTVNAISRMHFDSLRHHYLTGGQPVHAITSPDRQLLSDLLGARLPTFEAMHTLYTKAHLVGHVLLPRLALFDEPVAADDAALADLTVADIESVVTLSEASYRLYRRARDEFWQYGDREASYLQADLLNAQMTMVDADLTTLAGDLQTYEKFIESTGFRDLRSYPQLYYARWHILRHFASLTSTDTGGQSRDDLAELEQAAQRLDRAFAYDRAVGNEYGLHRVRVLQLLLASTRLQRPVDTAALREMREQMARRRYGFEAELLSHLLGMRRVPLTTLLAVFRYYPIVHQ